MPITSSEKRVGIEVVAFIVAGVVCFYVYPHLLLSVQARKMVMILENMKKGKVGRRAAVETHYIRLRYGQLYTRGISFYYSSFLPIEYKGKGNNGSRNEDKK